MKKITLLTTILPLLYTNSFSQTSQDRGYLSLTFGPSIPLGAFANKNVYSQTSGLAKTGQIVSLSYTHLLNHRVGIAITAHGQRNPVDLQAIENSISNTDFRDWNFDKTSWLLAGLLVGGYRPFPLIKSNDTYLILETMVGAIYAKSPELTGNSMTDSSTAHAEQTRASGFGFIYIIKSGINHNLNKKLFISASLEYLGTSKISFSNIKSTISSVVHFSNGTMSVQQSSVTSNTKQIVSSLNIHFGIGLRI
jgi:hypothetical protein